MNRAYLTSNDDFAAYCNKLDGSGGVNNRPYKYEHLGAPLKYPCIVVSVKPDRTTYDHEFIYMDDPVLIPLLPNPATQQIPVMDSEEAIIGEELVTLRAWGRSRLTQERLDATYNQGGKYGDFCAALAPLQRVYAVGADPEAAILALAEKVGWGEVHGFQPKDSAPGTWFYRFWSGGGTSMKAAGRYIPGGVIVDWWK